MQQRSIGTVAGGVVVLISMIAACDKSPTRPAPTPNGPALARVEISGPETIAPGATAKYTLTGFLADGTTRDVTAQAVWRSSNAPAATIDQAGLATGVIAGETLISGTVAPNSSAKTVVVTPPETFRLRGVVFEDNSSLRIGSAIVEVRTVTGVPLQTVTGPEGTFELYAVPGDGELHVTHDGYLAHTQRLQLSEHATVQIPLKVSASAATLSGTYTLTVGDSPCQDAASRFPLANELRQRTYTAVVTQVGSILAVTLSGTPFNARPSGFTGKLQGTRATFELFGPESIWYGYYQALYGPDVAEQLSDGTFLVTSGNAELTVSSSRWQGTLNGNMRQLETVPNGNVIGWCSASIALSFTK